MKYVMPVLFLGLFLSLTSQAIILRLGQDKDEVRFEDSDVSLKRTGRDLQVRVGALQNQPEALSITLYRFDLFMVQLEKNTVVKIHLANVRGQKAPFDVDHDVRGDILLKRTYEIGPVKSKSFYTLSGGTLGATVADLTFEKLGDGRVKLLGSAKNLLPRANSIGKSEFEIDEKDPIYFEPDTKD